MEKHCIFKKRFLGKAESEVNEALTDNKKEGCILKKPINIIMLCVMMITATAFLTIGCTKDEPNKNNPIEEEWSITYLLCQEQSKAGDIVPLQEYIKYLAIDKQTLQFEQGLIINCCCDSINATKLFEEEGGFIIDVCDYGNSCNCLCLGQAKYNIGDLHEGNTYLFTFKRNSEVRYVAKITFATDLDQTILLNGEE
jgi:hypothetical protein